MKLKISKTYIISAILGFVVATFILRDSFKTGHGIIAIVIAATVCLVFIVAAIDRSIKPEEKRLVDGVTMLSAKSSFWLKRRLPIYSFMIIASLEIMFVLKVLRDPIQADPPVPLPAFLFFEGALMVVLLLLPFAYARIKEVGYGSNYVYVSNFYENIRVPFEDIKDVHVKYYGRFDRVSIIFITFKHETRFGKKVHFIPYKIARPSTEHEHPVVAEFKKVLTK